jgi:hypothetical protein
MSGIFMTTRSSIFFYVLFFLKRSDDKRASFFSYNKTRVCVCALIKINNKIEGWKSLRGNENAKKKFSIFP